MIFRSRMVPAFGLAGIVIAQPCCWSSTVLLGMFELTVTIGRWCRGKIPPTAIGVAREVLDRAGIEVDSKMQAQMLELIRVANLPPGERGPAFEALIERIMPAERPEASS